MNRRRGFLFLLIAVSLFTVGLMVAPYAAYLLTGLLLAFIGFPLQKKLRDRLPDGIAAAGVIILTVLAAILPFGIVGIAVAGDASEVVRNAQQIDLDLESFQQRIEQLTGQDLDLEQRVTDSIKKLGNFVAGSVSGIVGFASGLAIGVSLMLFIQFYGLKDGDRFIEWTKKFDLIPTDIQEEIYSKTARTTRAVIKGHVFVAIAQGIIAGIGLVIVGIPNFIFWTFVMILLGFIPLIGTMFVWLPASVWLLLQGNVNSAMILLAWGFIVVGAVDNFLRPYLIDDDADLHPLFVILGVIGGIGVFGVIGLFLGPVMFGVVKNLLEIYLDEYETL